MIDHVILRTGPKDETHTEPIRYGPYRDLGPLFGFKAAKVLIQFELKTIPIGSGSLSDRFKT